MLILLLVGAALLPEPPAVPFPEQGRQAVRAIAEPTLYDAETARWRWPNFVPNRRVYCGYVNAKNLFGGYTGYSPFMVYTTVVDGEIEVSDLRVVPTGGDKQALVQECRDRGSLIDPLP